MDEFAEHVQRQLGRRIRRRRRALDLSQEVVAERAGIHRTQMSLFEHGERMPLTATLLKLAAALDISVSQLLVGVEWKVAGPRPGRPDGAIRMEDSSATDGATEERAIDLPEAPLAILREEIVGWLVDAAADLTHLVRSGDPDMEVSEVAALGRLAVAVRDRTVHRPDATALAVVGRLAGGIDDANRYDDAVAAHDAFRALAVLLAGGGSEGDDDAEG